MDEKTRIYRGKLLEAIAGLAYTTSKVVPTDELLEELERLNVIGEFKDKEYLILPHAETDLEGLSRSEHYVILVKKKR
ncbi:hypothetical protein GOV13_02595 [Candidatus Pacearchaeota archaeon]|nr:hypothetical protein [Candidatus Pacearchaeota archaeon]